MIRPLVVAAATMALGALPVVALAQSAPTPAPSASPSPAATATPSAIGPALSANDPCTTLSAIVTRPTVTNAVCTVRPDHVEFEAGYQNTTANGTGQTVTYPQGLIRIGTKLTGLEVQILTPNYVRTTVGGVAHGTTDIGAGLKYVLGSTPKVYYGVQVNATAPTGQNGFSAGGTQTLYALQGVYIISPALSLFAGAQDQILTSSGRYYGSFVPSLGISASLPAAFSVYGEIAQFTHALGSGTPTRTQYIGGIARDFGQRLQIDAEFGFSPTVSTGKYHYVGAGFAYYI